MSFGVGKGAERKKQHVEQLPPSATSYSGQRFDLRQLWQLVKYSLRLLLLHWRLELGGCSPGCWKEKGMESGEVPG